MHLFCIFCTSTIIENHDDAALGTVCLRYFLGVFQRETFWEERDGRSSDKAG